MMRIALAATACLLAAFPAHAQRDAERRDVGDTIRMGYAGPIPNIPGKSLKTVLVTYAPGGSSSAHSHARSAFILGYVLEGEIVSAVNGGPPHTFRAGETFTENPGDHHAMSYNGSKTRRARLLAIFVVDTNDTALTTPDHG